MNGIAEFASRVEIFRAGRTRVIWSEEIRAEAVRLLRGGANIFELVRATRIAEATFDSWRKPKNKIVEVKVKPETTPPVGIEVVIAAKGFTISIANLTESALGKILSSVL